MVRLLIFEPPPLFDLSQDVPFRVSGGRLHQLPLAPLPEELPPPNPELEPELELEVDSLIRGMLRV